MSERIKRIWYHRLGGMRSPRGEAIVGNEPVGTGQRAARTAGQDGSVAAAS